MKRFRSAVAGLLALLLFFPTLSLQGAGGFVHADGIGGQVQRKFLQAPF